MTEFEKKFEEEWNKQKQEIQKPNLLIVGGTGVGKSSLINRIFGKDVAKTGAGKPITKGIDKYESEETSLVFWDAEGYEISTSGNQDRSNFETNVIPKIEEMNRQELKNQIHLVWYCISITKHRVTDYDLQNIRYFINHNMKTAIIFTQCDNDEEDETGKGKEALGFSEIISKEIPNLTYFVTCASNITLSLDLEKLIDWSIEALPNEQLRKGFIQAQKVSIAAKKTQAYKVVKLATATTTATGLLNPIPLSDALLLAPQQLAMCISITNIFWMNTGLSSSVSEILKTQIVSLLGKSTAASLSKFIPIFGQIVNGVVAGGITFALGSALIEANAMALEEFLNTGKLPDWFAIFSSATFVNAIKYAMNNK